MDVVLAIDDVLFLHQCAKQWQRRLDAVDDKFIQRAL